MKRTAVGTALMAVALLAATMPSPGSAAAAVVHDRFFPTSVAFWDRDHGVLGGYLYYGMRRCPRRCRGVVAVTNDGGRHWRPVHWTAKGKWVANVAVAGENDVWAEVHCPRRCRNVLVHSGDRGSHWSIRDRNQLFDVSFVDAEHGWALRSSNERFRKVARQTSDGGRTWRFLANPCWPRINGMSVFRVSQNKGWVACVSEPATQQQEKVIKRTVDGGRTWQRRGPKLWNGHLDEIFFLPDGHGWLWGPRNTVYRTHNGAKTWRGLRFFESDVDFVSSMWFVSLHRGYAVFDDGFDKDGDGEMELITTWDGGRHWKELQSWRGR